MDKTTTRALGWIIAIGASTLLAPMAQANPFAAQMDAVVRIGSVEMERRTDAGLVRIEDAERFALTGLDRAVDAGVDASSLRLAELNAKNALREASRTAQAELRGMSANTVETLGNFGATPAQLDEVMSLWAAMHNELSERTDEAMLAIEGSTSASGQAGFVGGVHASNLESEAEAVLVGIALDMEAQLRADTDALVRTLRMQATTSMHPRDERRMLRDAQRHSRSAAKDMRKTVRVLGKQFRQAMKSVGADRDTKRGVQLVQARAETILRDAMDDAMADIKAAKD